MQPPGREMCHIKGGQIKKSRPNIFCWDRNHNLLRCHPAWYRSYPLMRTIIRGSLITEDLLRLAYCKFCSPSGVHSLPVRLLPSHRRQLSHNRIVGSYSLSFNGLNYYYNRSKELSTNILRGILPSVGNSGIKRN